MKKKEQHAKFFCENCGAEVPENAKVCRHCGRFFSSVRCPKCGASGPSSMFDKGCPNCGYAMNDSESIISYSASDGLNVRRHLSSSEKKGLKDAFSNYSRRSGQISQGDGALPAWVYIITICVLAGVLAAVYSCIK